MKLLNLSALICVLSFIFLEACQSSAKKKKTQPDCNKAGAQYGNQTQNQYNYPSQQSYGLTSSGSNYDNGSQYQDNSNNNPGSSYSDNQYQPYPGTNQDSTFNGNQTNPNTSPQPNNQQQPGQTLPGRQQGQFGTQSATVSWTTHIQPLMQKYCVQCHSASGQQSDLSTSQAVQGNIQGVFQRVSLPASNPLTMPPSSMNLTMTDAEKQQLQQWQQAGFPVNGATNSGNQFPQQQLPQQTQPYNNVPNNTNNPCL